MKLLGAVFAVVVLSLMTSYTVAMWGATDEGVDLTGTDYEAQYETSSNMMLINNSVMGLLAPIFMVIVLLGSIIYMGKVAKRY